MHSLIIQSPAKLNLTLRVIRKQQDGYHKLVTLFHRISLHDTLHLEKRGRGIILVCSHPDVPKKDNLIRRAYHLLKAEYPFSGGVRVQLKKRIPVGGGLGGGSSNAAHFLLGMNRLFRLRLSPEVLMNLGKRLGADVPFFISGARHALGLGRGDEIQPLAFRRCLGFLIFPSSPLSTARVYSRFRFFDRRISLTQAKRDVKLASAFLEKGKSKAASQFLKNDLTESAERLRPALCKARERLLTLQLGSLQMSGSGPTFFFTFPSLHQARRAYERIRKQGFANKAFLCHSD